MTGLVLSAGIAGTARAGSVIVTCDFLSFTSYIGTDRTSFVNGVALTASTTQISPTRFLSDPVNLGTGITHVDFNYDLSVTHFLVNSFDYTPTPQTNINAGDTFQWGTIRFTNGQWWEEADLSIRFTSHSADDPDLDGHVFVGILHLTSVSSPPPFDPFVEADFFWVVERPDLGSMRVFGVCCQPAGNPGNSGDFAFNGKIGSLIPTGFVALNGAGFTNPSVQPGLALRPCRNRGRGRCSASASSE